MLHLLFICRGRNPSYLVWPEGIPKQQTGNRRTNVWQLQQLLKQNLECGRSSRRPLWRTFAWHSWSYNLWQDSKAWLRLSSAKGDADPGYGYGQVVEQTLNLTNTMGEVELDNSRVYVPIFLVKVYEVIQMFLGNKDRNLAASGCINSHFCVITASLSWRGSWARSCSFQFYIQSVFQPLPMAVSYVAKMCFHCSLAGLSLNDRVRSSEIQWELSVEPLSQCIIWASGADSLL